MRLRRLVLTTTTAGLLALAFAQGASAKTATIGSALNLPMNIPGQVCTVNCLSVQQALASPAYPLLSPANGVVTEWRVRSGDPDARYTLRMLTPSGGNAYTATTSVLSPAPVPPGTTDTIFTYPGNDAPIEQGQAIGLLQTGNPEGLPQNTTNGIAANVIANQFAGNFPDGAGAPFIPDVQHELLLQATIQYCEVPKLKGKPVKKAKKALRTNDCGVKVKKKSAPEKEEGDVIKSKRKKGFTAAPGTPIRITVGK